MTTIPQKAIDLILESEGIDQPSRWPGGGSGITLGYGCDIGADPHSLAFWKPYLKPLEIELLEKALGKTGQAAKRMAHLFQGITVKRSDALEVFQQESLPREIALTLKAFPGVEFMPAGVLGAMVSLVYNRGTAWRDEPGSTRRREMRIIREILLDFHSMTPAGRAACLKEYAGKIAIQFRKMKRLWVGKGLDGLLVRRDAEADLIERSI